MSDEKYPPFRVSVPDRDTGEFREVEFNYSRLTVPLAYQWERQCQYFISVLFQWRALLTNITAKDAESTAYTIKRESRREESLAQISTGEAKT